MKKKIVGIVLVMFLLLPVSVLADNRVINGNEFDVYKRTKEDIYNKWKTGKLDIPSNYNDIYESLPSYKAPYKAGVVKQSYLDDVVDNLNYYRYLVGSPEVTIKTSNDNDLQTAEVVQNAYYNATHSITHKLADNWSRPSDMEEEFWNLGVNAKHNIISYNLVKDPNFSFFDESIFDKYSPQAGHRVALLVPSLSRVDYGIGNKIIYGRNTKDYSKYNDMDNSFAAYPSPGYFPKEDFADTSDWDVYLNMNDFYILNDEDHQKNVVVTIKNLETNEVETRSVSDNTLNFDYLCSGNYCDAYNVLHIKQPTRNTTYYNGSYEVNVKNLISREDDEAVDLVYTVNFYDKYEVSETTITDATFDLGLSGIFYDGEYNENLLSEAIEDINLDLDLESGYSYNLKVNSYSLLHDKKYSNFDLYYAKPSFDTLPNWITDSNKVLDDAKLPLYGSYNTSDYKFQYKDMKYTKYIGDNATLSIAGLNSGLEDLFGDHEDGAAFVWIKEKDGVFSVIDDEEKYSLTEDGLNLTIKNINKDDEANYYVTALAYYEDYANTFYFLSKPLSLTVNKKVESISFEDEVINLVVNNSKKLEPIINPTDATYTLTWKSSDNSVVSVNKDGNIKGLKKGSATITVTTNNNKTATIKVNVNDYMKGDMNKNQKIDLKDIIILIKKYLNSSDASSEDITIGDMNNNGKLDLKDIIILIRTYLGLEG